MPDSKERSGEKTKAGDVDRFFRKADARSFGYLIGNRPVADHRFDRPWRSGALIFGKYNSDIVAAFEGNADDEFRLSHTVGVDALAFLDLQVPSDPLIHRPADPSRTARMEEGSCRADWFPEGEIDSVDVAVSMDNPQQLRIVFADGTSRLLSFDRGSVSGYIEGVPLKVAVAGVGTLSIPDGAVAQRIAQGSVPVGARIERRLYLWLPGLLIGGVLSLALLTHVVVPRVADRLAPRLPLEWVLGLGSLVYEQIDRWVDVEPVGQEETAAAQEIERIGRELAAPLGDDYPFRFLLDRTEDRLNAFALPDGTIIFTFDLYEKLDENEVAGVLAHEIAHVTERHGVEALLASSAWFVLAAFLFPDPSLFAYIPSLAELSYSREAEHEADCVSAAILAQAGYPSISTTHALDRLEEVVKGVDDEKAQSEGQAKERSEGQGGGGTLWDFLSTHPDFPERIAHARKCAALEG